MNFLYCGQFDIAHLTVESCRGELDKSYGAGLAYYHLKDIYGIQMFSDSLRPDGVRWAEVTIKDLLPHRDHGITAALNLYIEPALARTQFWTVKEGEEPYAYPGERVAAMYKPEQLEPGDSFIARRGDAYWLDLSQVHTVKGALGKRTFIQFSWNTKTLAEVFASQDR